MQIRLAIYNGNTNTGDILPAPAGASWGDPLNDSPALSLKYAKGSPNGNLARTLLDNEYDLAVQLNWGAGWVEPRQARFVMVEDQSDAADEEGMIILTGVNVADYDLAGIYNLNPALIHPDTGARKLTGATAGKAVGTMIAEGKSYGLASVISTDFTNTNDSAGVGWSKSYSELQINAQDSALSMLQAFTDMGFCDRSTQGNTLQMYNVDSELSRNRYSDGANQVALVFGRDIADAPQRRSRRDYISNVVSVTDSGKVFVNASAVVGRRGRRATVNQAGGITGAGDATLTAQGVLDQSAKLIREQLTRKLIIPSAQFLPYRDYRPGDFILAPGSSGKLEQLRVRQITLTWGEDGTALGGNLVLNDRFLEGALRAQRRLNALDGGGKKSTSSTPSKPEAGKRKPAKLSTVTADSYAYVPSTGVAKGLATITWSPVTADASGVPLDVDRYEVRARRVS